MRESCTSGGKRGETVAVHGMRTLRHCRGNPETELCRNLNMLDLSSTRPTQRWLLPNVHHKFKPLSAATDGERVEGGLDLALSLSQRGIAK